jgi:hypothetical protein
VNVNDNPLIEELLRSKKGSIFREFPREWMNRRWSELERAARAGDKRARKARKLLTDRRFAK